MTIKAKDLRDFDARYHRNGVGGNGFHVCNFTWGTGKKACHLSAVVFPEAGNVAVISAWQEGIELGERWRGDDFETAIRESLQAFAADPANSLYCV